MAIDIFTDQMQHAELFNQPVLTTNWLIPRTAVPDGWFCYDMSGTEQDPDAHAWLLDHTGFYHSGTVLSPTSLKDPSETARKINRGDYFLHGEEMDLETFCEEYDLAFPTCPKMDESLEDVLLEECFRRWYDVVQDDPSLSDGTGFAAFCREMSYELLADHDFMADYHEYQAPSQTDEPSF